MKRSTFLKGLATTAAAPVFLNGVPVSVAQNSRFLQLLSQSADCDERVLVMIQLNGGNDGLNTLIPLDKYSILSAARSNVLIPENKVLGLNGQISLGLHPTMTGMQSLFNEGIVSMVQNVGYPSQDFSHFRSTDIWLSGSSANVVEPTGWMGRYLQGEHPSYPSGYPNTENPDPLAIQIGYVVSPAYMGNNGTMGMAITNPDNFYQLITDTDNTSTETPRGHELSFIRQTARQTNAYADRIKAAAALANNQSSLYPAGSKLADQLKIVARLIAGGLKTKAYMVTIGGFDTHATQVDAADTTQGVHADLLTELSDCILAFQDDIQKLSVSERVMGMTFSEFGRRIKSNGSTGTDHGAAAPLFLFGAGVKGGVIGNNPNIPDNPGVNDNVPMEFDFRAVYASILKQWFCVPDPIVDTIFGEDFDGLPITTGVEDHAFAVQAQVYPNPFCQELNIGFESMGGVLKIEVFDNLGHRIFMQDRRFYAQGSHLINIPSEAWSEGYYSVLFTSGSAVRSIGAVKIKV